MENSTLKNTRSFGYKLFVSLFTGVIAAGTLGTLLFAFEPNTNAIGAFGTVCMDVACIIVMLMLIINLTFEKAEILKTTKLFLSLMLATAYALFFDFLVWSFDGALAYWDITYLYIVASLFMGPILAGIFVLYLSSYMVDIYEMKSAVSCARICIILNFVAMAVTVGLAVTGNAFVIENGHYVIGELYDFITVIPVLTLLIMTGFTVFHVKTIGVHDTVAVAGYIFTMICGALIEASYDMGTTYVSVTIANVFIFVMLQSKLFERVNRQKEALSQKISSQYRILESMAGIYSYVDSVDLEKKTVTRLDLKQDRDEHPDLLEGTHTELIRQLYEQIVEEQKERFWQYTDLSTLPERMKGERIMTAEFQHKEEGWIRTRYIRIGEDTQAPLTQAIFAVRNIDAEKKNVEKWILKSNTDELTGFLNRHAYEEEIAELEKSPLPQNFVYVSIDVNGLKQVNDRKGHSAGDELIIGACRCISRAFGANGKLYRTGGDEFVALIYADELDLLKIKRDFIEQEEGWTGKLNDSLNMACGYVTGREAEHMTLHQVAVLADKRMYEDKSNYYQRQGVDRRGQKDAHVALCALYTKILKINVTEDTYQVVNMNENERTDEMGYAETISGWLSNFGTSGQVHPEDLDNYLRLTNLEYLRNYFRENQTSLKIFYRRKAGKGFEPVMMEIIPANDYTPQTQKLFLYVKSV